MQGGELTDPVVAATEAWPRDWTTLTTKFSRSTATLIDSPTLCASFSVRAGAFSVI